MAHVWSSFLGYATLIDMLSGVFFFNGLLGSSIDDLLLSENSERRETHEDYIATIR